MGSALVCRSIPLFLMSELVKYVCYKISKELIYAGAVGDRQSYFNKTKRFTKSVVSVIS